jgi:heme exporter protein D
MDGAPYGWLSEALFSGVLLVLLIWQWVCVRRAIARRKQREALRKDGDSL